MKSQQEVIGRFDAAKDGIRIWNPTGRPQDYIVSSPSGDRIGGVAQVAINAQADSFPTATITFLNPVLSEPNIVTQSKIDEVNEELEELSQEIDEDAALAVKQEIADNTSEFWKDIAKQAKRDMDRLAAELKTEREFNLRLKSEQCALAAKALQLGRKLDATLVNVPPAVVTPTTWTQSTCENTNQEPFRAWHQTETNESAADTEAYTAMLEEKLATDKNFQGALENRVKLTLEKMFGRTG